MNKNLWSLLLVAFLCIFASMAIMACGDDDDDNDDDTGGESDDDDTSSDDDDDDTPPVGCDTLVQGLNSDFMVNGLARSFYLDLPDNVEESYSWPVVFNWHGFGDTAANMRTAINWLVNFDGFPFIAVTPEDSKMFFDWDIIDGANPNNREVLMFDALLEELDKCFGVDPEHIHVMGFSFGGGVADLMGVSRGDVIASIATMSGIYGSNPENSLPEFVAVWPNLTTENKYVEFRLHGGVLDNMILPFGQYGENDLVYLNENGHDYVHCVHPYIHNMGFMFMGPETFVEFFRDHPKGTTTSPYMDGFPDDYKDTCSYHPKNQ